MTTRWELDGQLLDVLSDVGARFERVEAGAYVVHLHGTRRPFDRTLVWLVAGEQAVAVESFVLYLVGVTDRVLGEVLQLLAESSATIASLAYGDRLGTDAALAAKVLSDGAGRRPAGTPERAPRRDVRR